MSLIITTMEQGLIYGILALGVYITYKILDFPDLTVDGSFPLGGAVGAALITKGMSHFWHCFWHFWQERWQECSLD